MAEFFFRDGRRYEGHQVCNYNGARREGKVSVYRECDSCHGKPTTAKWPHSCGKCGGIGHTRQRVWKTVYTAERLAELNQPRSKPITAKEVVRAQKKAFARFCRDRDLMITMMKVYAPRSEPIELALRKVNDGIVLTPREIRETLRLIARQRNIEREVNDALYGERACPLTA